MSPDLPLSFSSASNRSCIGGVPIRSCSGATISVGKRKPTKALSFEQTIATRSTHVEGKAKTSYYGIEVHSILNDAKASQIESNEIRTFEEMPIKSVETVPKPTNSNQARVLWTEKYRAVKFTDLVGDERSHRTVLRWLKSWDHIVFPGQAVRAVKKRPFGENVEESQHRKILMLHGPPGLGKTTLAHVCAKQAGYEVLEINASDERSRDVVRGRIKDSLGTENVRGIDVKRNNRTIRRAGRPVCVVVDEVDGVVGGSGGGGEGGFVKALIDLIQLDQQIYSQKGQHSANQRSSRKDAFRMQRPLILICNDVYHPSLRPLRASHIAEVVHLRNPPLEKVVLRMKSIFEKEGVMCDNDAVRRLCEATWGVTSRKEGRSQNHGGGEGDIRSVLVTGEWIAQKIRFAHLSTMSPHFTRKWLEESVLKDGHYFSSQLRGFGWGGVREVIERVFLDGAGLAIQSATKVENISAAHAPKMGELGVADLRKRQAINHLREMVETCGEHDRCVIDSFSTYPSQTFQDDSFLSKPTSAYEWLHFHDRMSSKVSSSQEWELAPYLSQSVLAFHHLFASVGKPSFRPEGDTTEKQSDEDPHPFSGARADFAAYEAEKQNRSISAEILASFSSPLMRLFRSTDALSGEFIPYVCRILSPDVKPVVVGGSGNSVASVRKDTEKKLVQSAVRAMNGLGVNFEKVKVDMEHGGHGGFVYRMEP